MVLVSNEWQNKCEDETKTTANTATTAGTTAITTTTTTGVNTTTTTTAATIVAASISVPATVVNSATNCIAATTPTKSETIAADSINSIPTISSSTKTFKTLANDYVNNEQIIKKDKNSTAIVVNNNKISNDVDDDNNEESQNTEVEKNSLTACNKQLKEEEFDEESLLNYNNIQKIMAENTKETSLKEEEEHDDSNEEDTHELITNNFTEENNKDLDESNSFPNSNTNTLQAPTSITITPHNNQQQNIITQQQVPLSCPITPQALSSALQSALNATNNANNSVQAAAGLQPNFLSQLALTANVAGLQNKTTAKQLNQSFNIGLDVATIQTAAQNDSNLLDASVASTAVPVSQQQTPYDSNGQSKIVLICEGNSHPFQSRTISLTPNVECMVGRLIAKSKASESNAIFDCKVLSRKHAVIWYTPDGKFWVKDTKSSNGTFINDNKLGDEEAELHFGDIVKFGVDVLENSRKEVHGCIIACVKLYLPDGREAISIDSCASHRSQYSGEGRISYDELHRLNLYIQETSQREKVLTSKLCSIQNILDATRKNSALCWQSMITEDQLLHRIHSLEKKLQFMEKNVPENLLRNEVLKLLEDKNSYQHAAKEAIRKVYQERCDAIQMLAKMESAYTQSDNECSLLRDQIMNSKQTLQDVNTRLLRLETEFNEYKDDAARLQQEAKEHEEQRIAELTEKLRERELECEDLKRKISELLIKRADMLDDEEQLLEKQAIEKLDEAFADMDLGEDEDDDDEDEDSDIDEEDDDADVEETENKRNGNDENRYKGEDVKDASPSSYAKKQTPSNTKKKPHVTSIFGDNLNGLEEKNKSREKSPKLSKLKKSKAFGSMKQKTPPTRVRESTIMNWLKNSDLNKNESSFDIFKAICNENDEDSSEEYVKENKPLKIEESYTVANEFSQKCTNFTSKLKNVQKNLKQLEAEIENETENITKLEVGSNNAKDDDAKDKENMKPEHKERVQDVEEDDSSDEDNDEDGAAADEEFYIKRNGKSSTTSSFENKVLSKENKKYLLLKSSVNMLREAYNEIWDSVKEQEEQTRQKQQEEVREKSNPLSNKQFQHQQDSSSPKHQKLEQQILRFDNDITGESDSEVESLTLSSPVTSSHRTVIDIKSESNHNLLQEKLKEYQSQVGALNEKLQQTELEAQHTLEIMQVECDDVKQKMENLNKVIKALKDDKLALEQELNDKQNNKLQQEIEITTRNVDNAVNESVHEQLERELEEDQVIQAINATALEREEELITYKERLDEQQKENIDLRNEIADLKLKANTDGSTKEVLLKQFLPYGIVVIAIIVYFLTTYF